MLALDYSRPMPPLCALYNIYNENYWLPYSVASIYSVVDQIVILVSEKPWYGPELDQGDTLQCIESIADPEKKIRVLRGAWSSEAEQRNTSLAAASVAGAAYALIIDADEIYHPHELTQARALAASRADVDCWHINWITYWKSVRYRIDPLESYQPVVLIKLGQVGYLETRNPVGATHALIPPDVALCHHMSYALSDERLALKHISYAGHSQTAHATWLETKWRAWDKDPEIQNLHPNNPETFARAVAMPKELLPTAIRDLYDGVGLP